MSVFSSEHGSILVLVIYSVVLSRGTSMCDGRLDLDDYLMIMRSSQYEDLFSVSI